MRSQSPNVKRHGLINAALRAPKPGTPFAYVTTEKFLGIFGLATLRDLPDIERLEDEGLWQRPQADVNLDGALGLAGDDDQGFEDDMEFDEADEG